MSAAPPVFGDLSRAEPGMIYMAASLVAALGIDYRKYARTGIAKPGESSYDWSAMRIDATARVESLMKLASDAQAKLLVAERERDEAQAEVRAMLKDRIEEEEQARMRLLESVLAAAIHPKGLQATVLLPKFADLMHGGASEASFKRALMHDLNALVALGLRGEVVPRPRCRWPARPGAAARPA